MIIALDLSTNIIGLAARGASGLVLRAISCPDEPGMSLLLTATKRLWPALNELHEQEPVVTLVVEVPPPTYRDDNTGRAQRQAVIGLGLGRAMMLGEAWAYTHGVHVRFVANTKWHRWATKWRPPGATAPRHTRRAEPPRPARSARPPERVGSVFIIAFDGCDHVWKATDLASLQRRPDRCPTCTATPSPAEVDRLAHKEAWVRMAAQAWPAEVEAVASAARARARNKDKPLHQLAGVADACDAALMLQYALTITESDDDL